MKQIKFTIETPYGPFTDCITYNEETQTFTDEEIEAEKQRRVDYWISVCFPQPSEETPPV